MKRYLPLFVLIAVLVAAVPAAAGCHKCAVKSYVGARNAHDADKVLALVAEELRIIGPDGDVTLDGRGLRELLDWDAATHASVSYEDLAAQGDVVSGLFTERNDVYALLGVSERRSRLAFRFDGDRIREIRVTPIDGSRPVVSEALEPFLAWASSRHPGILDEIYPGGSIACDADSAETWLELLREWRAS